MKTLDFGKHEGERLADCPVSYIKWLARHRAVLAKGNQWASRLAQKLLEEKNMFNVGDIFKLNRQFGDTVCVEVVEVGEKIKAKLLCTHGVYEYEKDHLLPASQDDIALAAKQWKRTVAIHQEGLQPLTHIEVPADFGMFEEDGVRIA